MKEIKLVLAGCGTVFPVYLGVLKAIEVLDISISGINCTSGGALIGSLIASGFNSSKLEEVVTNMDFKSMQDWSLNPFYKMGLLNGDNILKTLKNLTNRSFSSAVIPINIVTTDIETADTVMLNVSTAPNVLLADAARASLAIPLLFKYYELVGKKLVDGGTTNNFNIDGFGEELNIVGIRAIGTRTTEKINIANPISYIGKIAEIMIEANEREHIKDAVYANIKKIVVPYDNLSFNHTKEDVKKMIKIGNRVRLPITPCIVN